MSTNIKNEQTVELVRQLARRTGVSQTSAVEEAIRAKLAELENERGRDARRAAVDELLSGLDRSVTTRQRHRIRGAEKELYDAHGLPR